MPSPASIMLNSPTIVLSDGAYCRCTASARTKEQLRRRAPAVGSTKGLRLLCSLTTVSQYERLSQMQVQ
jgi:hypothetical protein